MNGTVRTVNWWGVSAIVVFLAVCGIVSVVIRWPKRGEQLKVSRMTEVREEMISRIREEIRPPLITDFGQFWDGRYFINRPGEYELRVPMRVTSPAGLVRDFDVIATAHDIPGGKGFQFDAVNWTPRDAARK